MKKIVLFTMCNETGPANYGQVLQCYALYKVCLDAGFEVRVLRHRTLELFESVDSFPPKGERRNNFEDFYRRIHMNEYSKRINTLFEGFIHNNIERTNMCYSVDEVKEECSSADIILIGSDQLWYPEGLEEVYCPDFFDSDTKIVTYATSGIVNDEGYNKRVIRRIAKSIEKYYAVSVRERVMADVLEKYTNKKIDVVIDPTFLLRKEDWDIICGRRKIKERYVLCFCYGGVQPHMHCIKKLIKEKTTCKKIVVIKVDRYEDEMFHTPDVVLYEDVGPIEWISLIKYADVVLTDSFHGFAFSLIYQKEVYLLYRAYGTEGDSNVYRMRQICDAFCVGNRWLRNKKDFNKIDDLDYGTISMKRLEALEHCKSLLIDSYLV